MRRVRTRRPRRKRDKGTGHTPPRPKRSLAEKAYEWRERDIDRLRRVHETRTPTARSVDEALVAPIAPTPEAWLRKPNEYDVHGVDYPELKVPKAKQGLEPHERMQEAPPERQKAAKASRVSKRKTTSPNPFETPSKAKKYLAPLVNHYKQKMGVKGDIKLVANKQVKRPKIRLERGKSSELQFNYEFMKQAWEADPQTAKIVMKYMVAHELAHQKQREELGWKGFRKAGRTVPELVELDADGKAAKALGIHYELIEEANRDLARRLGGSVTVSYHGRPKEKDLSRFKDFSEESKPVFTEVRKQEFKRVFKREMAKKFPQFPAEDLDKVADKAIKEGWIRAWENPEEVVPKLYNQAAAELIMLKQQRQKKARDSQIKALKGKAKPKVKPLTVEEVQRMDTNELNKLIRQVVKATCPTVKVRSETGTAAEWLEIKGSKDKYGNFTEEEKRQLKALGIEVAKSNGYPMNHEDKIRFLKHNKLLVDTPKTEAKPPRVNEPKTTGKKPTVSDYEAALDRDYRRGLEENVTHLKSVFAKDLEKAGVPPDIAKEYLDQYTVENVSNLVSEDYEKFKEQQLRYFQERVAEKPDVAKAFIDVNPFITKNEAYEHASKALAIYYLKAKAKANKQGRLNPKPTWNKTQKAYLESRPRFKVHSIKKGLTDKWEVWFKNPEGGDYGYKQFNTLEAAVRYAQQGEGWYHDISKGDLPARWETPPPPPKLPPHLKEFPNKHNGVTRVKEQPTYDAEKGGWVFEPPNQAYGAQRKTYTLEQLQHEYELGQAEQLRRKLAKKQSTRFDRPKARKELATWRTRVEPYAVLGDMVKGNGEAHPRITVKDGKVEILGMNTSHTTLTRLRFPDKGVLPEGEYAVKEVDTYYVAPFKNPKAVEWDAPDRVLRFHGGGKEVALKLADPSEVGEEIPMPKLRFDTRFTMKTDDLLKLVKNAAKDDRSMKVILEAPDLQSPPHVKFTWTSRDHVDRESNIEEVFEPGPGYAVTSAELDTSGSKTEANYDPRLLEEFLARAKKMGLDTLTWEYKEDMPLLLKASNLDGVEVEYYQAPMIGV